MPRSPAALPQCTPSMQVQVPTLSPSLGLAAVLIAGLALSACSGGNASSSAPFATRDSAGVPVALSGAPAWSSSTAWTVEPQLVFDIAGTPDGSHLTKVNGALRLPDGDIVIADGSNQLLFFDDKGGFLRAVGGSGSGAEQFLSLRGIALAGDTILAFDAGGGRVVSYDQAGRRLGASSLIATPGALSYYRMGGPTTEGVLLLPDVFPAPDAPRPGVYWDPLPNVRFAPTGAMRDTVGDFSGMDMYVNGQISAVPPFGRRSSAVVAGGKLYIGDGGTWEVHVYDGDGQLERIVRWQHRTAPVSKAIADSLVSASVAAVTKPSQQQGMRQLFQLMPMPKRQPAFDALVVDSTGDIWLRDYRPNVLPTLARWHVFGPDGRLLGAVTLPRNLQVMAIGGDWILGSWADNGGNEHVQMLRLRKSAPATASAQQTTS